MTNALNKPNISSRIFRIRGLNVILDRDLAILFDTSTKRVNEIVKRNPRRFPSQYLIQLDEIEKKEVAANCDHLSALRFSHSLPYCFSEHGVAMLATLLKNDIAIQISIEIINVFIHYRQQSPENATLHPQIEILKKNINETNQRVDKLFSMLSIPNSRNHGIFFNDQIFDAYVFACELIQRASSSIILNDNKELYHIGASLKDLGKKWFAFSRIDSLLGHLKSKL